MRLAGTDTVVVSSNQLSTGVGKETVILNMERGEYFGLNEVGASIWDLLQRPRTVDEIKSEILAEYDVTPEQCERDLLHVLSELLDAGVIEIRNATSGS